MRPATIAACAMIAAFVSPFAQPAPRPQDDLYRSVNAAWLERTLIPDDRVSYTAASELIEKANVDLRALIDGLAAQPARRPGSAAQQIVDLFASMMNEAAIDARGASPLAPELAVIDAIDSVRAMAERAGRLSATTTAGPFFASVGIDPRNPADRLVQLSQGGLLLERDLYLREDDAARGLRSAYRGYLAQIFALTGRTTPAADADAVLALEIELARGHRLPSEGGDPVGPSHPLTPAQMNAAFPGFDWPAWAAPQGLDRVVGIIVVQPSFFRAFAALVPARPLSTWRAWLAARYITALAPYVHQPISDARFEFFGRTLTGQQVQIARWKRGVSLVNALLGDAIGRLYVERHFPRASRTRVERMVQQILNAYRDALGGADWMSSQARSAARDKLARLTVRIGYPDVWRDYRGLEIRPDDLFGNLARSQQFENARRMRRISQPDDRGPWTMTPQNVNAAYVPAQNEIVVPAGILQPPYFDAAADDAVNFGAIGAVIGHEIGHALDETGRQYDANGLVRDWWRPQDEAAFRARTDAWLAYLRGLAPVDGLAVNAPLVLAESLSDLIGVSMAHRAYRASLGGRAPETIDGATGDQRFFIGWARIWRAKVRPEYQRQLQLFSRYLPAMHRANAPLGHLQAFYEAFGVREGDALFVNPAQRVRVY